MKLCFPKPFLKRLEEMYPDSYDEILGEMKAKPVVLRSQSSELRTQIEELGGEMNKISGFESVYEISGVKAGDLVKLDEYRQGFFYIQSLASLAIPMVLAVCSEDRILDLCAAPGSKTSQMAQQLKSKHEKGKNIVAVEIDGNRCKRLREVLELQGVSDMVEVIRGSGIHLPDEYQNTFDKVLVDAPCSADARFDVNRPRTFNHWAKWRIKSYGLKQKKLVMAGLRYLKPGGVLVYSTCSVNPEENEAVMDYILRRYDGEVRGSDVDHVPKAEGISNFQLPISKQNPNFKSQNDFSVEVLDVDLPLERLEPIMEWHGKKYDERVGRTFRMKPDRLVQPFFVAKIRKMRR